MEDLLFISVGHPAAKPGTAVRNIPVKVSGVNSPKNHAKQRAAKLVRLFAMNAWMLGFHRDLEGFMPEELYWAIFPSIDAKKPIAASDNFYWRRK